MVSEDPKDSRHLMTVTHCEEVKAMLALLPILATNIVLQVRLGGAGWGPKGRQGENKMSAYWVHHHAPPRVGAGCACLPLVCMLGSESERPWLPPWLAPWLQVVYNQMSTLFVLQGTTMERSLGSTQIPAASMSFINTVAVMICVVLYDSGVSECSSPFEWGERVSASECTQQRFAGQPPPPLQQQQCSMH